MRLWDELEHAWAEAAAQQHEQQQACADRPETLRAARRRARRRDAGRCRRDGKRRRSLRSCLPGRRVHKIGGRSRRRRHSSCVAHQNSRTDATRTQRRRRRSSGLPPPRLGLRSGALGRRGASRDCAGGRGRRPLLDRCTRPRGGRSRGRRGGYRRDGSRHFGDGLRHRCDCGVRLGQRRQRALNRAGAVRDDLDRRRRRSRLHVWSRDRWYRHRRHLDGDGGGRFEHIAHSDVACHSRHRSEQGIIREGVRGAREGDHRDGEYTPYRSTRTQWGLPLSSVAVCSEPAP
jgi:hypothetical protein